MGHQILTPIPRPLHHYATRLHLCAVVNIHNTPIPHNNNQKNALLRNLRHLNMILKGLFAVSFCMDYYFILHILQCKEKIDLQFA